MSVNPPDSPVTRYCDCDQAALESLLARFGLRIASVADGQPVPGSFWGDTPLHSALHEACHYICMDEARRAGLDTDAGGGYDEENAVCYLQILLADRLPGFGRERMMSDMDAWGYSFRLGSARAWFEGDADDAREWLIRHRLISRDGEPTFCIRGD
jgi:hypothetical protein